MEIMHFKANEGDKSFDSDPAQMNQHFSNTYTMKLCWTPNEGIKSTNQQNFEVSLLKQPGLA